VGSAPVNADLEDSDCAPQQEHYHHHGVMINDLQSFSLDSWMP